MVLSDQGGATKPIMATLPVTPTKKATRRRSWFGLVSPSRKERVSVVPAPQVRQTPVEADDHMEELDLTPVRGSADVGLHSSGTVSDNATSDERDGELESTVRRKRPSKDVDCDDGPVRMKDMATLAILSRNNTSSKPRPFSSRIFSRSASDRDVHSPPPDSLNPPAATPPTLTPSKVPRRTSSIGGAPRRTSENNTEENSPLNKPLPSLPGPSWAPLPPVSRPVLLATANAPSSYPIPPTDIVVTPSSPLERDPFDSLFGLEHSSRNPERSASAPVSRSPSTSTPRVRSESPSPMPSRQSLGKSFPAALGRPSAGLPTQLMPQTVSSPLPTGSRPASPTPKVTFTGADDSSHDFEAKDHASVKAPRPRSLSAMFSRSPLLAGDATTDDDEPQAGSKFSWLGVRKTIRRRRSESRLGKQRESENDTGPSNDASANERGGSLAHRHPNANASTPMLLSNRSGLGDDEHTKTSSRPMSIPFKGVRTGSSVDHTAPPSTSTSSSLSSSSFVLPAMQHQPFFAAQDWTESPSADVEEMFGENDISRARKDKPWLDAPASARSSYTPVSALGSLPETGPPPTIVEHSPAAPAPPAVIHGRGRSMSDPRRRVQSEESLSSSPRSPFLGTDGPQGPPQRPVVESRSSSSNSLGFGKVRNVFSKGRPRSNSTLRYGGSADEREDGRDTPHTRPESSASAASFPHSPALPPVRIRPEDVPQVSTLALQGGEDDRRVILTETPERSPRSSYAASQSSRATESTRRSATADPYGLTASNRGPRARASTIASGAISWQGTVATAGHGGSTTHLPAQPTFPTAATPPRQRAGSIRRLSNGLFRANPASPKPANGSLFPLPPRSGSVSSPTAGPIHDERSPSPIHSARPGSSLGMASTLLATPDFDKERMKELASIRPDDTPESWLERVSVISRRELAGVLADSSDPFHTEAMRLYMSRFDFTHIALDVALRRLLMHMSLPKETQQIDRVIEAFAVRYDQCEPGLFGSKDNAYVLAFSMMMLHTDAFNRHNKNKMSKADYVRNTRLPGVPEVVLEAFYDNITFTPFVFIEDDNEASLAAIGGGPGGAMVGAVRSPKIDVYDLIVGQQLGNLRVDVERHLPADSPFSCMGTQPFLDVDRLQRAFANAHPLQFVKSRPRRKSSVTLASSLGEKSNMPSVPKEEFTTLKITKVGLLSRRDDSIVNGKRVGNKRWKSWSVVLTGSQLLFFKDTIWALTMIEQIRRNGNVDSPNVPRMTGFQPDEVLSVKDCVAVFDREYAETPFTFRFVMPGQRQYLMQAVDEMQMNEWLTLINYASTFKTAGIRMRAAGLNSGDAVMAGAAAAESHIRDLETGNELEPTENSQTRAVLFASTPAPAEGNVARPKLRRVGSIGRSTPVPVVDIAGANDVVVGGGEQIEAVIGSVKAELAAGRGGARRTFSLPPNGEVAAKTSRTDGIQAQVSRLRAAAEPIEKRLSAALRVARNLALLTPFQKSTRDHVETALPDLAKQIRSDRVELAKLHLWITMLLKDQERDQRDWARVRHVALQAAAKSLRHPHSRGPTDKADRRKTIGALPMSVPKLSLPDDRWAKRASQGDTMGLSPLSMDELPLRSKSDDERERERPTSDPNSSHGSEYDLGRRESSEYMSASSALSFREELDRQLGFADSEPTSGDISPGSSPFAEPTSPPVADEAEDWRNTRAATKVSLASLPHSRDLSRAVGPTNGGRWEGSA